MKNEIKNVIKKALKNNQLNQKQLANYLQIDAPYLSNLLNGRFNFTDEMLLNISLFLGIPKELLGLYNIEKLIKENEQLKEEIKELKATIKHIIDNIGE